MLHTIYGKFSGLNWLFLAEMQGVSHENRKVDSSAEVYEYVGKIICVNEKKKTGPKTLPCVTPYCIVSGVEELF